MPKPRTESITIISLSDLHEPEISPFNVADNDAMTRLADSIRQYGVREPGIARPRKDGSYELLCGNRRKRACELAGLSEMPVIIRKLNDDDAVITMVDSNLEQREELLFSEKAHAYRMKMEAIKHRGIKGKKLSVDVLTEQTGESRNQIFRLIRLTELIVPLIDKVDDKQLAFNPAVELSYLSQKEQAVVASAMEANEMTPSLSQAVRLKKLKQAGELTEGLIRAILEEDKPKSSPAEGEVKHYRQYFPKEYTPTQISKVITTLAMQQTDEMKRQQKRIPQITGRLEQIDKVVNKLYEDNALGAIDQDRYEQLSQKYSQEYYTLKKELAQIKEQLSDQENASGRAKRFIKLVESYCDFNELTPTAINEFISKIVVHERDKKGARYAVQHIEVYFNYIGKFENELTELKEPTEQEIAQIREEIEEAKREKSRAYHRAYGKAYRAKNIEKQREYDRMKAREYRARRKAEAAMQPAQ